jgi:pyruvate/2-oxoglutarate dehydrogenase complex dihydrolipoamide dehydrogenase (E3) component
MSADQSTPAEYDIVVLGSGEGGKYIAWTMGKKGRRVAVIEPKYIGGSCPNIACLPSSLHSSQECLRRETTDCGISGSSKYRLKGEHYGDTTTPTSVYT